MNEDADKIIEKLNDFPYRGKNLSVSYSRKPEAEGIITETVIEATGSDAE